MLIQLNACSKPHLFPEKFGNQIYYSQNTNFYFVYKSVYSIKYAIDGGESYLIGKKHQTVPAASYLLVNNGSEVSSLPAPASKALSIFLEPNLVHDVFANRRISDEALLANPFESATMHVPHFFEHVYTAKPDLLKHQLAKIHQYIHSSTYRSGTYQIEIDHFYQLAQCLIGSQQEHFKRMRRIKSKKVSTKKELYRRVLTGRDYIVDNWQKQIFMEDVARVASLSPFHFHRTFTDVFGMPPSRFARQIKIERAKRLLLSGQYKVKEVAAKLGYADGFSFSKAFKREVGMAPTQLLNG